MHNEFPHQICEWPLLWYWKRNLVLVLIFSSHPKQLTGICESSCCSTPFTLLTDCLCGVDWGRVWGERFYSRGVEVEKPWWPAHKQVSQTGRQAAWQAWEAWREGGRVTGSLAPKEHWLSDGLIPNNPRLHPRLNKFSPAFSVRSFFVNPRYSSLAHNSITLEEAVSILYILLKASNVILTALELYLSFFSTDKMFCKKIPHKMYNFPTKCTIFPKMYNFPIKICLSSSKM